MPLIEGMEETIEGFCAVEVKPKGPLQEYVPPPEEESAMEAPSQYGPVFPAEGTGTGFTVTDKVEDPEHPAASVVVTE